jgi:hypothetical protein
VIGSALAADLTLKRQDLKMVAVYSATSLHQRDALREASSKATSFVSSAADTFSITDIDSQAIVRKEGRSQSCPSLHDDTTAFTLPLELTQPRLLSPPSTPTSAGGAGGTGSGGLKRKIMHYANTMSNSIVASNGSVNQLTI